jgi:CrcB protein
MRGRLLLIFLLGGGGALARYLVAGWAQRSAVFPFGTLAVNVLGCFLFGLIYAATQERFFCFPNKPVRFS